MDPVSQRISAPASESRPISLSWAENPAVQKLLDVVASIIAEEYIQTARQNPEVLREIPACAGMTEEK